MTKAACKEKAQEASLSVLYGDGTVSKEIITGKTPIGIVFDTDNRLAVALTDVKKRRHGRKRTDAVVKYQM